MHTHSHAHVCTHTCMHTAHIRIHTLMPTYTCTHSCSRVHTCTPHSHIRTHIYTLIYTCTHTHPLIHLGWSRYTRINQTIPRLWIELVPGQQVTIYWDYLLILPQGASCQDLVWLSARPRLHPGCAGRKRATSKGLHHLMIFPTFLSHTHSCFSTLCP